MRSFILSWKSAVAWGVLGAGFLLTAEAGSDVDFAHAWPIFIGGFALGGVLLGWLIALTNRQADVARCVEREQVEEVARNALRFQQVLMDTVPSPIFYKDAKGVYLGGNKAFGQYLGLLPEQYVGKTVYDIAPVDLAKIYDKADKDLLNTRGVQTYEAEVVYADGSRHQVVFNKAVLTDAEGNAAGLIGVMLDITAHKAAEDALRASEEQSGKLASLLRLMCDNVPDMIWAKDLDGRYIFSNRANSQFLNAPDNMAPIGKTGFDFAQRERAMHPDDPQWYTFGELCEDTDQITLGRGVPSVFEESGNVQGQYLCLDVHKAPFVDS